MRRNVPREMKWFAMGVMFATALLLFRSAWADSAQDRSASALEDIASKLGDLKRCACK